MPLGSIWSSAKSAAKSVASFFAGVLWDAIQNFVDIMGALVRAIVGVMNDFAVGFIQAFINVFVVHIGSLLVIQNPRSKPGLIELWYMSLSVFAAVLVLYILYYLLMAMVFSSDNSHNLHKRIERLIVGIIVVLVSQPLFELIITVVNVFTIGLLPADLSMEYGGSVLAQVLGTMDAAVAFIFVTVFGTSIFLATLMFYVFIAIRLVIIYTIYGFLPILILLLEFKSGPMKYGRMFSKSMITLTAMLLIFGIFSAGVLHVGFAVATGAVPADDGGPDGIVHSETHTQSVPDDGEIYHYLQNECTEENSYTECENAGIASDGTGSFSSESDGNTLIEHFMSLFMFFGSIFLVVVGFVGIMFKVMASSIRGKAGTAASTASSGGSSSSATSSSGKTSQDGDSDSGEGGEFTPIYQKAAVAGGMLKDTSGSVIERSGEKVYSISGGDASSSSVGQIGTGVADVGRTIQESSPLQAGGSLAKEKHRAWKFGPSSYMGSSAADRKMRNVAYAKLAGGANRLKNGGVIFGKAMMEDDPRKSFGILADGVRKSDILDPDEDPEDMEGVPSASGPPEYGYGKQNSDITSGESVYSAAPAGLENWIERDAGQFHPDSPIGVMCAEKGVAYEDVVRRADALAQDSSHAPEEVLQRMEMGVAGGNSLGESIRKTEQEVAEESLWSGIDMDKRPLDVDVDQYRSSSEYEWTVSEKRDEFLPEVSPLIESVFEDQPEFSDSDEALAYASRNGYDVSNEEFESMYRHQKDAGLSDHQALVTSIHATVDESDEVVTGDLEDPLEIEGVIRKMQSDEEGILKYELANGESAIVEQCDSDERFSGYVASDRVNACIEPDRTSVGMVDEESKSVRFDVSEASTDETDNLQRDELTSAAAYERLIDTDGDPGDWIVDEGTVKQGPSGVGYNSVEEIADERNVELFDDEIDSEAQSLAEEADSELESVIADVTNKSDEFVEILDSIRQNIQQFRE